MHFSSVNTSEFVPRTIYAKNNGNLRGLQGSESGRRAAMSQLRNLTYDHLPQE